MPGRDEPAGRPDWVARFAARTHRGGDGLSSILALADAREIITFSGGFPAPETFPVDLLGRLSAELLADDPAGVLQYSPTQGLAGVRDALAGMLADRQERRPEAGEVLVTSGGIEALSLLARVFLEPGDAVVVEAPTYLGALMGFAGAEAELRTVATDADGLRPDELRALLASGLRPKFLYVIPEHQNPTGRSLSLARRRELLEVARRYGLLVVEDVAYRDLSFDGSAPPSLWALGPDVVVQVGTFSKIFTPGVRLGWAVGPRPVVAAMTAAKQNSDQCSGSWGQRLMERYVRGGHLEPHLVAVRRLYRERAEAMLAALARSMPPGVVWTHPRGGFFVWVTLPPGVDTRALVPQAAAAGVAYVPGAPFYPDGLQPDGVDPTGRGTNELRLAFSRATGADIAEGIGRLGRLFDQALRASA